LERCVDAGDGFVEFREMTRVSAAMVKRATQGSAKL
jgi:hypothetical protein